MTNAVSATGAKYKTHSRSFPATYLCTKASEVKKGDLAGADYDHNAKRLISILE